MIQIITTDTKLKLHLEDVTTITSSYSSSIDSISGAADYHLIFETTYDVLQRVITADNPDRTIRQL
jgi:hypothetical protein